MAFLRHVLPHTGPYCIAASIPPSHRPAWQLAAPELSDAVALASDCDREGRDVFFAIGALVKGQHYSKEKDRNYVQRTASNMRGLRSYILDIDAGPDRAKVTYLTSEDALAALIGFCQHYSLPKPTIVQSGFGLHVYWTLENEVPAQEWMRYGAALKSMAATHGLAIDPGRTADAASVLRVVGTRNFKYDPAPKIVVLQLGTDTSTESFHAKLALQDFSAASQGGLTIPGTPIQVGEKNIEHSYTDLHLNPWTLAKHCGLFHLVLSQPTKVSEPAWHGAIMLARFCGERDKGRELAHTISKSDPRYNEETLDKKLDRFDEKNYGPINCAKWQEKIQPHEMDVCRACPHFGKITSPAELARMGPKRLPAVVQVEDAKTGEFIDHEILEPPYGFIRTEAGIGFQRANSKTGAPETTIICPCDMYPMRIQYDEQTRLECEVVWNVHYPHEGWVVTRLPHVSKNQLQLMLVKNGIRVSEAHIDIMELFMSAYTKKLQMETPREVAYARMGWRRGGGFVVGDTFCYKDGTVEQHEMSVELDNATKRGMRIEGDLDEWKRVVRMYGRKGLQAYRLMIYASFASPLYHMAGQVATCVSAIGIGGIGKSTVIETAAAIWGDPSCLVDRGGPQGFTRAAVEATANAMHHLPIFLDEVGQRDAKDLDDFIFNYSGGTGKIRSKASGGLRADRASWSNICLLNANINEYERMSTLSRESAPNMMRLMQLEFKATTTISKEEGDDIRLTVHQNYGHAGRVFAEYIAKHETLVRERVVAYRKETDRRVAGKSEERFWTAGVGAMRAAAEVAYNLGLLDGFPITEDIEWLYQQIGLLRSETAEHRGSADELMTEYIHSQMMCTLRINAKNSGNIDNTIQEPRTGFTVRWEEDNKRAYVSCTAFRTFCVEHTVSMQRQVQELMKQGVVLQENVRKVLGAGTKFASGNIRCIEIDTTRLNGGLSLVTPTQAQPVANAKTGP